MYLRNAAAGSSKHSIGANGRSDALALSGRSSQGQAAERGRYARMWVAALSVVTLVLLGASPALATGVNRPRFSAALKWWTTPW